MKTFKGNTLKLGMIEGSGESLVMSPEARSTHLYISGSTGTGKSKMLEHLVRQDILQWPKTKCGMLVLDPHGSLYDSLVNWIAWEEPYLKKVPIVPIDLRQTEWTMGYNVLRPRATAEPSVVISNFVQAMSYVWGVEGTQQTPLFARIASNVLWSLYENKMTLLEAEYLINQTNKRIRSKMTDGLSKRSVVQDWAYANSLSAKDFNDQISSTVNRFHSFLNNEKLRLMFGQGTASLDFNKALDEGTIVIVNLSTEKTQVCEEDSALLATLLLTDLWTAAKTRGKGRSAHEMKPFYCYVDEFQNFIIPTIAKNLDQARGFGLHLTLANQFPRQIFHAGAHGPQVLDSVMNSARSKLVFETRGEDNLRPLALDLFMGTMNPDEIKHELFSTRVLDYVEEKRIVRGKGISRSSAVGNFSGITGTESMGGSMQNHMAHDPNSWNQSNAKSSGKYHMDVDGESESETEVPFLRPIIGKELSSVQFRGIDEQIFRAMAVLHDQKQRHCVARLVGMHYPAMLITPNVKPTPADEKMEKSYLKKTYKKLPFALKSTEARKLIEEREDELKKGVSEAQTVPVKRRIK